MAQDGQDVLTPLIEGIMAQVDGALTEGLEPDAAAWAERVYRSTILPWELRFAVDDTEEMRRTRVEIVTQDLLKALGSLTPADRWDFVLHRYYLTNLMPYSDQALELAERRFAGDDGDVLAGTANQMRERIRGIAAEIEERAPQVRDRMREVVSESLLDCAYAAGETDLMSLRMGAEAQSAHRALAGRCASCGRANPEGSRFCNNCGKSLEGSQA